MKTVLLLLFLSLVLAPEARGKVTRHLTGDGRDVRPARLHGPALNLVGGGGDVDAAMQWMIDSARGCADCPAKLDVVVLRSSGADGYNKYIYGMRGVDSVETLVVTAPEDSNTDEVAGAVERAEVVFFAGGDQCNYVKNFRGTRVERAVESVYRRGGAVGGTSAGEAIQGEFARRPRRPSPTRITSTSPSRWTSSAGDTWRAPSPTSTSSGATASAAPSPSSRA
jgi:cyanophycinase-like exopeptidase